MSNLEVVPLIAKIFFSSISVFLGIVVWRKIRDISWVYFFLGVVFFFVDAFFEIMVFLGFFDYDLGVFNSVPVLQILSVSLPFVFMSLAFLSLALRRRDY